MISRFLKKAVAVSDGSDNEFLSLARDVSQTGSDGLIVSAVAGSNATDEASKYESNATTEMPKPKADLHMRIDRDILEYFRKSGKGYQTRINAVLRSYVNHMRSRETAED